MATDSKDKMASFSNYGVKSVHVAAPGVNVYSSRNQGGYETMSGTSMASPHVAGVAALLLQAGVKPGQMKAQMIKAYDEAPVALKVVSKGRLNVMKALP